MTITLNNVNKDILQILKSLVKLSPELKINIEKKDDLQLEYEKIIADFEEQKKEGKTKIYKNIDEYKKAMDAKIQA